LLVSVVLLSCFDFAYLTLYGRSAAALHSIVLLAAWAAEARGGAAQCADVPYL